MNAALASGPEQSGPDVSLCAIILGVNYANANERGLMPWTLALGNPISLYPWQVNGMVALTLKLLGFVPMQSQSLAEHAKSPR